MFLHVIVSLLCCISCVGRRGGALNPTLVVSAAASRGLWAQAVPVPVIA